MESCNLSCKQGGKSVGIVILLSIGAFLLISFLVPKENNTLSTEADVEKASDVRESGDGTPFLVSTCSTFYSLLREESLKNITLIDLDSSQNALATAENTRINTALIGRKPKPKETVLNCIKLEGYEGYSFISSEEQTIYLTELQEQEIYTSLNPEKLSSKFNLNKVSRVENVYDYIDIGIGVISWESMNYAEANMVHVLNPDDSRFLPSRAPYLCCKNICDENIINQLTQSINSAKEILTALD